MPKLSNIVEKSCRFHRVPRPTRFLPLTEWQDKHPWPKTPMLRHMAYYRSKYGIGHVFKKVGGKILIDETALLTYIANSTM